jgi:signal transduction histidine kinase
VLGSLRARLIASYAFVVFISLALVASAFLYLVQQYQMQREMERLADIVLPLNGYVRYLELRGVPTSEIAAALDDQAEHLNVRLLLVRTSDRLVAADTADELQGYILPPGDETPPNQSGRLRIGRYQAAGGQFVTITVSGSLSLAGPGDRFLGALPRHAVMVAVPQASLAAAWLALAPRLLVAGALALFASLPIALWLAQSVTGPLARITRASEEMARGKYDQQIPVEGRDEVARLARAFNLMAKRVSLSHRTLREFLADVSHELRTPLTSIRGFAQAMTDGTLRSKEDYVEAGHVIHEEAERMARLVEDLLYLSRVESGQFAVERVPLDLAALVNACIDRAQRRAQARGVTLTCEAANVPPVAGEAHRLEQVVDNLLDNALKHTPEGGRITVRLETPAAPPPSVAAGSEPGDAPVPSRGPVGPGVRLTVHNTGSVIPPDEQELVFDRFYRARGSAHSEGTGLGLAIVRQIVQSHGGRIGVTSSAASGTEFWVWLPAAADAAPAPPPMRLTDPATTEPALDALVAASADAAGRHRT